MCLEGPTPTPTTRRWEQMCDEVWCVTAPHALTLERLRAPPFRHVGAELLSEL